MELPFLTVHYDAATNDH